MMAVDSNISGLFSLLSEELYKDYTGFENKQSRAIDNLGSTSGGDT